MTTKIRGKATGRKCQNKVHRMEMKTAIRWTRIRHTKILIEGGVFFFQAENGIRDKGM